MKVNSNKPIVPPSQNNLGVRVIFRHLDSPAGVDGRGELLCTALLPYESGKLQSQNAWRVSDSPRVFQGVVLKAVGEPTEEQRRVDMVHLLLVTA